MNGPRTGRKARRGGLTVSCAGRDCSLEEGGQECPPHTSTLALVAFEIVDEHLLDGLVVGLEDVADSVAADEMANFFGEILGVVAGALQRLRHEDALQAGLMRDAFGRPDSAGADA